MGWGEVINGGFGLVVDGSPEAERRLLAMLHWDVNNGIARRAWARNPGAEFAIERAMEIEPRLSVTMPHHAVEAVLDAGYRTRDIVNEGNADETLVGCKEMGDLVAAKVAELAA